MSMADWPFKFGFLVAQKGCRCVMMAGNLC